MDTTQEKVTQNPRIYNFSVRNEYGMDEPRRIYYEFWQRFPNADISKFMKKWPSNVIEEVITVNDRVQLYGFDCDECEKTKIMHEETRVELLKEMVSRIKSHDDELEIRKLRELQLQNQKLRWQRQRSAGKIKTRKVKDEKWEKWVQNNYTAVVIDNTTELFVPK